MRRCMNLMCFHLHYDVQSSNRENIFQAELTAYEKTLYSFITIPFCEKHQCVMFWNFLASFYPTPTKFCQYFILLIENFNLYSDEDGVKHIRIKARPNKWHENDCPFCHKSCPAYDKHSSRPTTWRGLDWGGILVEVEYQTHRIICLEHGVICCRSSMGISR